MVVPNREGVSLACRYSRDVYEAYDSLKYFRPSTSRITIFLFKRIESAVRFFKIDFIVCSIFRVGTIQKSHLRTLILPKSHFNK